MSLGLRRQEDIKLSEATRFSQCLSLISINPIYQSHNRLFVEILQAVYPHLSIESPTFLQTFYRKMLFLLIETVSIRSQSSKGWMTALGRLCLHRSFATAAVNLVLQE
jgi:hypothetical protein